MKIAVIAANGRAGQAFVEKALAAGHSVQAGILGTSYLKPHPNLTPLPCDATKEEDLQRLISGQEAVVSLIGHVKGSQADVQTKAIEKVVAVMGALKVSRLISLTGTGVRFPGDRVTILDRFLNFGVGFVDPDRVHDGQNHVEVIKKSNLDWTVIRVLKLQNVPARPFTLTEHGPTKPYVSREEVAEAILQVLEQNSFIRQAPIISPV